MQPGRRGAFASSGLSLRGDERLPGWWNPPTRKERVVFGPRGSGSCRVAWLDETFTCSSIRL